jgi:hypothetical protein
MGYSRKKFDKYRDNFKSKENSSTKKKKKSDDDLDINITKKYNKYD